MTKKHIIGLMLGVGGIALPFLALAVTTSAVSATGEAKAPAYACTMDAKMCPDGTYVGRTGPNCEFVCPTTPTIKPTEPKPLPPTPTPTKPPIGEVLRKGMTSTTIKDVQTVLKTDPTIYIGPVTGYYGSATENAVKKIQIKYGLPQTGVLDEATQRVIFPYDTRIDLGVVAPNGGEVWKTGDMVKILWKATFGPGATCVPPPSCLYSEPRCLPAEPVGGWCPSIMPATNAGATSGSTAAGSAYVTSDPVSRPSIVPFFPRATVTLTRDSDPSFVRNIGTVNLYESAMAWSVPRGIPEAKDYRVRIAVGGDTPCLYRAEAEAKAAGRALDANLVYPCPMMDTMMGASTSGASAMYYGAYSSSDSSDNTFAILTGNVVPDDRLVSVKRQLAEIEAMLSKIAEQVRMLNEVVAKLSDGQ